MLCYRDRTFCRENLCGDPNCSRVLTDDDRERANRLGLAIAYAEPCVRPQPNTERKGGE